MKTLGRTLSATAFGPSATLMDYFLGVDVGTGSVRASLVESNGRVVATETCIISTWNDKTDFFEQSSDDIWNSICKVVKKVTQTVTPDEIKGVGFDATCSLVAIDLKNKPLTVSPSGKDERNIILWMDHRAKAQAAEINKSNHRVLDYVGGAISLEMQMPKLMWLRENLPSTWSRAKYFFDLPDFLTWKATGDDSRSICSVVCKWTFITGPDHHEGWDESFFKLINLEELLENEASKIGSRVNCPGTPCGAGLLPEAAGQLGLHPGTPVGASIIDAHAGGLGLLGCHAPDISNEFDTRLGLICGTSTCHMAVADVPHMVPGVWGPYFSAQVPGMWLSEGGQSATGKLLDHIIETHPAFPNIKKNLDDATHMHQYLHSKIIELAGRKNLSHPDLLTETLHIWPDFHGNRSPVADPSLLGMISGLSLSADEDDLAVKYLATIQALAYGTRHIVETLRASGHDKLKSILLCGGLAKNPLFVQTHADVLGLPVLLPREPESVLLGAAMLAAVAAGKYSSVDEAVQRMGGDADVVAPQATVQKYHERKYKVFLKMLEHQREYASIMSSD